jgi:hypothetical protein
MTQPNDITPPAECNAESNVWKFLWPDGPSPWHTGENRAADDAMSAARAAYRAGDGLRCLSAMRVAMTRFGWDHHPDGQACLLLREWNVLVGIARRDPAAFARRDINPNYGNLFYKMSRAVYVDEDRCMRRNKPPDVLPRAAWRVMPRGPYT